MFRLYFALIIRDECTRLIRTKKSEITIWRIQTWNRPKSILSTQKSVTDTIKWNSDSLVFSFCLLWYIQQIWTLEFRLILLRFQILSTEYVPSYFCVCSAQQFLWKLSHAQDPLNIPVNITNVLYFFYICMVGGYFLLFLFLLWKIHLVIIEMTVNRDIIFCLISVLQHYHFLQFLFCLRRWK